MAKPKNSGLSKWFKKEKWVDISAPKKGGGYEKCGRKSAKNSSRGYPKCVPTAKAKSMSKSQIKSAVARKRANPSKNVRTIVKRKK
jgi:hypothetical protein